MNRIFLKSTVRIAAPVMLTLFLVYGLGSGSQGQNKPNLVNWSVRVSPTDASYLEVILDPRKVPCGYSLADISYDVSFYTYYGYLGAKKYVFSKQEISDLKHSYRDRPSNPYPQATKVKAVNINYTLKVIGTYANAPAKTLAGTTSSAYSALSWPQMDQALAKSPYEGHFRGEWNATLSDGSHHVGSWDIWIDSDGGLSGTEIDRSVRASGGICGYISRNGSLVFSLAYPMGNSTGNGTLSKSNDGSLSGTLYQDGGSSTIRLIRVR